MFTCIRRRTWLVISIVFFESEGLLKATGMQLRTLLM